MNVLSSRSLFWAMAVTAVPFLGACQMHDRGGKPLSAQHVTLVTSAGEIELELDFSHAPISVDNFIAHARAGDYDGTIFHRVVPGFVVQGGGWTPELTERAKAAAAAGKPDKTIKNEWQNGPKNVRGSVAMAREEGPDTATREFYVNLVDNAKLDIAREKAGNAGYAVFGKVTAGMALIDAASKATTRSVDVPGVTDGSMQNVPTEPLIIRRIVIR